VIRPPAIGAKLLSVDESSIRGIPGVRVVRLESFLSVVAEDEWSTVRASRELKATWSDWKELPGSQDFTRWIREAPLDREQPIVNRGDPAAARVTAPKQLSATYYWPYQSHASLGPSSAVADVRDDGTTIWTSAQSPHGVRGACPACSIFPSKSSA
jgi:xanthine dehydrogenase molybdopterin-binding subunit B